MATAAQIQAEIAAGPQTQDALDAILVKYSPAELAAALPQYGGEADYANARAEAERREFIAWQAAQPDPTGQGTIGDVFERQGITDPKNDPRLLAQAQEQIDRATRREDLFSSVGRDPGDLRPWSDAPPPSVGGVQVGGGAPSRVPTPSQIANTPGMGVGGIGVNLPGLLDVPSTPAPAPTATPANPRIQAIQQWYNANVGRTDTEAQPDLNRFLATSGFTAREIAQAIPNWKLGDLQNAMRTAIGEVAKQTPFAPVAAQPIRPLAQPYTSIASQLPGGADTRMQEIRNWYAANEGRGDQAALDRFLASGYTSQELNRALPQFGVADLDRAIATARQQFPQAELQSGLAQYQAAAPGAQFTGAVSPYGLIMDQMQPFANPYADTLANVALGGYRPDVYNVLLDEKLDPVTGLYVPDVTAGGEGPGGGGGGDGTGNAAAAAAAGTAGSSAGATGGQGGTGIGEGGGTGMGGWANGGLVDKLTGPDPAGPDEGYGKLKVGEYVIKKSSVNKYGQGLLDMINDGKIPAKKIKSLLD